MLKWPVLLATLTALGSNTSNVHSPTSTGVQTPSLFKQVITQPTGKNGYEDYVRAAEITSDIPLGLAMSWTPTQYDDLLRDSQGHRQDNQEDRQYRTARLAAAKDLANLDELGLCRFLLTRYRKTLELIRAGNAKPSYDPRTSFTPSTLLPEFTRFKTLARVFARAAYAEYADGHGAEATQILLDLLTFARQIESSTLISSLMSTAMTSIVAAGFEENLPWLSHADAQKIARYVDRNLAEPPHYESVLNGELAYSASVLDTLGKLTHQPVPSEDDAWENSMIKGWNSLNVTQRAKVREIFMGICREHIQAQVNAFRRPESQWSDPIEEDIPGSNNLGTETPEQMARSLAEMTVLASTNWRVNIVRGRTQLRLLGLHARIIAYRWEHRRLPERLEEAVPNNQTFDPLSKQPFQYELKGDAYRLYSKGIKSTGEVQLRYQQPTIDDEARPLLLSWMR